MQLTATFFSFPKVASEVEEMMFHRVSYSVLFCTYKKRHLIQGNVLLFSEDLGGARWNANGSPRSGGFGAKEDQVGPSVYIMRLWDTILINIAMLRHSQPCGCGVFHNTITRYRKYEMNERWMNMEQSAL